MQANTSTPHAHPHHAHAPPSSLIASKSDWSSQLPTLLSHAPTAQTPQLQPATLKQYALDQTLPQKRRTEPPMAAKTKIAAVHKAPPSFSQIPNPFFQTPIKSAANKSSSSAAPVSSASTAAATADANAMTDVTPATAAPTMPTPQSWSHISNMPAPISKRLNKALSSDYTAFLSNLQLQSLRSLNETLPRKILYLNDREQLFILQEAKLASLESSQGVSCDFHFNDKVKQALQENQTHVGQQANATNVPFQRTPESASSQSRDDKTLDGFHVHSPLIRTTLPTLSAAQTQHGWTFFQPTQAHPTHAFNREWIATMQSDLGDFISLCGLIRAALILSVPSAMETSNIENDIRDELVGEVKFRHEWAQGIRGRLSNYCAQRAKLLSKCYKYPGIEDYQRGVIELDEYTRMTISLNLRTLRNGYALIHNIYQKNQQKFEECFEDPTGSQAFHSMI